MSKQLELKEPPKNVVAKTAATSLQMQPKETALGELHFDVEQAKSRDYLNKILSTTPPKDWVKEHPMTKGKYLPINRVEDLLRKIFLRFKIEIIDFKVIANSVTCQIRLHYIDPVSGEWDFQDGVGAMAIQVDKGSPAMDFNFTKSDAIMKALPAAKSYAVKDAAEVLGKLFGGDLNRKDDIQYTSAYDNRKPITTEQLLDAKMRAARGDFDILEIVQKLFIVTPEQLAEIEANLPKPE